MAKHLINKFIILPDNRETDPRAEMWTRHAAPPPNAWPPPDPTTRSAPNRLLGWMPVAARIDPLIRKRWLARKLEGGGAR